jgi:hypothetical protein
MFAYNIIIVIMMIIQIVINIILFYKNLHQILNVNIVERLYFSEGNKIWWENYKKLSNN